MTAVRRFALVGSLLVSTLLIDACVGDDPVTGGTTSDDGGRPTGNDSGKPPGVEDSGQGTDSGNGAACDGGLTCGGVCTDTASSAKNCGRCDHDCGTAKCTKGVCEAALVAGVALGDAKITSLTTDQGDDNPKALAQRIFWSVTGTGGGVFQDNVIGGNTLTLSTTAAAPATNLAVTPLDVFWFNVFFAGPPQPIVKSQVNTAGTTPTGVGSINGSSIQSILYDATNKYVIGSYAVNASSFGLFRCGPIGGTVTCANLTTFTGQPGGNIVSDGTDVYFSNPSDGFIQRSTLNGGSVGSYIAAQDTPTLLRIDGTNLYWTNVGTKTIQRGALAGSVKKQMASTTNVADGLAADAVNVYWTDSTTGTVNFAPVTGAGPNTAYVTLGASPQPMRLARDKGFLYFTHKGGIYRVALP